MSDVISGRVRTMSAILLTLAMASSLWRYTRYVDAINESSIALRLLTFSSNPRVVVVNGMEAADAVGQIAQDYGTPVQGALLTTSDDLLRLSKSGTPEIVLVELSGYFGPISEEILKAARPATGWRAEIRERFYRIYFR